MIPKDCKRLAEVDFPIAVVSKHAAREKSIRHGHPSTLHLWWARRPLAACRAVLLALLLPDPCDPNCPDEFKAKAKNLLPQVGCKNGPADLDLREGLLKFIGDFADWDRSADRTYLEVSRGLVKAAHPEEPPLVVDPFAGGGSIPLEALRLGCETFASDLNPVACLILKVMLEDIPRHGPKLAEELRKTGAEIKKEVEKEFAEFYPADPDGARPIAYLWARTMRCEFPDCGAEIPLARSFWLSKKSSRKRALRPKIVRRRDQAAAVEFDIFEPKAEDEVPRGTVSRAKATCLCCKRTMAPDRVRAQLAAQHGGANATFDDNGVRIGGARLLAVVTLHRGEQGRHYRLPTARDYEAVWRAKQRLDQVAAKRLANGLSAIPDELLPPIGTLGFRVQRYGMLQWGDLFTVRQKLSLLAIGTEAAHRHQSPTPFVLAAVLGRCADYWSSGVVWAHEGEFVAHTFGRQALPLVWDFAEAVPWTDSSGNWLGAVEWVAAVIEALPRIPVIGQVQQADANESPLADQSCSVWFSDPPYYDAVPYADLSDFFLVWLKRALPGHTLLRDPFDPANLLSPKLREAVQDESRSVNGRPKDGVFFEEIMAKAFAEGRRVLKDDGIGSVVFAHKTTEGWEALLTGMIRGGWTITGSWPIATERPGRLRSQDSAALATSVHLICRPRTEDKIGDWGEVLRELPKRVGDWMERLQAEHVRGADLVFACIGPALEIFSRYAKVETAEGREVPLAEYLEKVWEVVGRSALEQVLGGVEGRARNGAAGALEEDARLTALFLWTLQASNGNNGSPLPQPSPARGEGDEESDDDEEETPKKKAGGFSLVFDVARRFAQPLGIHLDEWEGRIIEIEKGVVRLLSVAERAKQLFGEEGASAIAAQLERGPAAAAQLALFPEEEGSGAPKVKGRRRKSLTPGPSRSPHPRPSPEGRGVARDSLLPLGEGHGMRVGRGEELRRREATTLDRVHAAMLLQRSGQANALRNLLKAEQERGPDFLRLANALSALYPRESEEKRLLDAMLLAVPR